MSKTTIISIPACASSNVLKSLHQNNINCKYVGIDQSGKILMELYFKENQNELIQELIIYMEKMEQFVSEFSSVINETLKKFQDEAEKTLDEELRQFRMKNKERKERSREKSEEKTTTA